MVRWQVSCLPVPHGEVLETTDRPLNGRSAHGADEGARLRRGAGPGARYDVLVANSPSGDAVLDRILRIFETLEQDASLRTAELAEAAGLPRTTGYRMIRQLLGRGFLAKDAHGHIRLGQRLWEIAQYTPLSRTLRSAALPLMEDVSAVVGQTTQLAVLDEDEVLIVERLSRQGAVANPAEVASRMPAHLTSMGHVLLAFAPAHRTETFMAAHQERIGRERPELRRELAEARSRGYAKLNGVIHQGTAGISVPVLDARGQALAALTIVVPRDWESLAQPLMALQTASRGIARALGREDALAV